MSKAKPPLPRGGVSFSVCVLCAALFVWGVGALKRSGWHDDPYALADVIVFSCAVVVPAILFDLFRASRGVSGAGEVPFRFTKFVRPFDSRRLGMKLGGLFLCMGACRLGYALFPEYGRAFYADFLNVFDTYVPWICPFLVLYVAYMDRVCIDERDGAWHAAAFALRSKDADASEAANYVRGWGVKMFFTPLMLTYMIGNMNYLGNFNYQSLNFHFAGTQTFKEWFDYLYNLCFSVDLLFACSGYLLTTKMLNGHIRTAEPTLKGWLVCLMCYEPFWAAVMYDRYFAYNDSLYWGNAFWNHTALYGVWAFTIIVLLTVYASATAAAGYRFSNLTYRGLYAGGPYRFTKHPAYVSKNLSWWLVSVPFIAEGSPAEALRNCILLLGVNIIYTMRARTEEAHLSRYPEYQEYALAMNERSVFAPLARLIPWLRYRVPSNVSLTPVPVQSKTAASRPLPSQSETSGVLCPAVPSPSA